jgi:DNA-directed RNA polymerase subunit RPC12/RpoP
MLTLLFPNKLNMYGCTPCPRCGSEYRWPTRKDHPQTPFAIVCDHCGHVEPRDLGKRREDK